MRVAANIGWLFPGSVRHRVSQAKAAGFTAVESPWPSQICPEDGGDALEEYRSSLEREGLEVALLNAWGGDSHPLGVAADPSLVDTFRRTFDASLQYAHTIRCKKIHVMSGMTNPSYSSQQHLATLRQNLQWAEPRVAACDVTLTLEPISSKPGYFMDSFDKALQAIKDMPSCRIQLDVFHLHNIKGELSKPVLLELLPYTGHVQISQPITRAEPSTNGDYANWSEFTQLLLDQGYAGDIGAEFSPSVPVTQESLQWTRDIPHLTL